MKIRTSNLLMSLFALKCRHGKRYFAGTYDGHLPLVIEPGQRLVLVKGKRMAPDDPETWSLRLEDVPLPIETTSPQIRLQNALAARDTAIADPGANVPNLLPDAELEDLQRAVHEQNAFFHRFFKVRTA